MAGHSKWKNIQHRKGAQDKKRGKLFTKILKEVTVAVKTGGGPEAESNPRLRAAISAAKANNIPKDTLERAIKKASGADAQNYEEVTFEGHGPSGVGIFVECATDNNTRTVANVRSYFNRYDGSLGKNGCLEFIFNRKGIFTFTYDEFQAKLPHMSEDDFTMEMLDCEAEDVEFDREEQMITVTTGLEDFGQVQKGLEKLNIECQESALQRLPTTTKALEGKSFETFLKLIDALEDDDDVQQVYHNCEFNQDAIDQLG